MPIYDPKIDNGDETDPNGLRLPGRRTNNEDGSFDVDYDIPMALFDCRLDDGVTPHKDAHTGHGETHPEWWGKTYFRHFPNHGFVGDIFTVNGTAYPVLEVKRRKYRLRFLDASISRIYDLQLMHSSKGPQAARDLGYIGDDLQGQYRLTDATQCMKWVQIANEGGLLPKPIVRDNFELWPAKRREFIVDFTKYMDGTPTKAGRRHLPRQHDEDDHRPHVGRKDPSYKVPLVKIVIGDLPDEPDMSVIPYKDARHPGPRPGRGRGDQGQEHPDVRAPARQLQRRPRDRVAHQRPAVRGRQAPHLRQGGLGRRLARPQRRRRLGAPHAPPHGGAQGRGPQRRASPTTRHPDDSGKEDVIALDPSEETVISRRFRSFCGPYVAHCHNLAHEDHNMMFGWEILP